MELTPESQRSSSPIQNDTFASSNGSPENSGAERDGLVGEILRFALLALLIVMPIRFFVAQPFIVSGSSMETTFATGQYLIVDQLTYHMDVPQRGDVIVFRYPKDPSKFFIKRVIGLPGDTVNISGKEVKITNDKHPDGVILNESYILDAKPSATLKETLGSDEYFVMGDNRDASSDSRVWGVLQRDKIVGRAFLRLFPLNEIGVFPGKHDINAESKL